MVGIVVGFPAGERGYPLSECHCDEITWPDISQNVPPWLWDN